MDEGISKKACKVAISLGAIEYHYKFFFARNALLMV